MEPRVFEYRDWVNATPETSVAEVQQRIRLGFIMTAALGVLAALCFVVLVTTQPLQLQFLAGLIILGGAAVMAFRKADSQRRGLRRADGDTVSMQGPYPLSVSDTVIHFPESFDDPADDWPLEGTTAELVTVTRKEIIALTHPGRRARHFYADALVDPVSEVKAEIESRQASAAGAPDVAAQPHGQADEQQDEGPDA